LEFVDDRALKQTSRTQDVFSIRNAMKQRCRRRLHL
jgi:hypothetical protein